MKTSVFVVAIVVTVIGLLVLSNVVHANDIDNELSVKELANNVIDSLVVQAKSALGLEGNTQFNCQYNKENSIVKSYSCLLGLQYEFLNKKIKVGAKLVLEPNISNQTVAVDVSSKSALSPQWYLHRSDVIPLSPAKSVSNGCVDIFLGKIALCNELKNVVSSVDKNCAKFTLSTNLKMLGSVYNLASQQVAWNGDACN